jgi:membrane-associated protease RseP (regulator of RpoE activity)
MGHYLTCLYYGIDVTLPYFIPAPTPMGTMGAFIKIRSQIPHRAALLDVGVAGPIAGFVLAVPTMIIGLAYSRFTVTDTTMGGLSFGEPLAFKFAEHLMGKTPPAGMDLYLHPIALAAWFGFLATMLNLLPAGQLDGGHMVYALFPGIHKRISQALVVILVPLGIWYWQGWLLWAVLLLLVIRLRHPMTTYDDLPLERRHILLGWIGLALLILCFMPAPLALIEGS